MHDQIDKYIGELGVAEPMQHRIRLFCNAAEPFVGMSFQDAVVSQTLNQDGTVHYLGVFFFTTEVIVAYTNITNPVCPFSIAKLRDISFAHIQVDEFTLPTNPVPVRRIHGTFYWNPVNFSFSIGVTGKNCDLFMPVYNKFIRPHIVPPLR